MKINMNILQSKENEKKTSHDVQKDSSFEAIFQERFLKNSPEVHTIASIDFVDPLLMQRTHSSTDVIVDKNPMDSLESVILSLAKYAEDLSLAKNKRISLVSLHEHFVGIENEIMAIKDKYDSELQKEPLNALLHSIEMLMLTEKYKINRGDYF
ncbi:MAG: hypothetical protein ACRCV3_04435 [Desulfovibrionaceae bacterium]